MKRRPDLLFIIDVGREEAAVHEANLLNLPIVAMVDTNCNPQNIDYVIPSNDDAIRAIKLLVSKVADAVLEGKAMRKEEDDDKPVMESQSKPDKSARRIPKVVDVDEEVEDKALLGEATLAKLSAAREDAPAAVAPVADNTEKPAAAPQAEASTDVPAEPETKA
jgi:small subunit ribosomal protein S2